MTVPEITRRQLLATVAGAGTAGAVFGGTSGAVLSDESPFGDGSITSGALDLDVRTEDGTTTDGTAHIDIELSSSQRSGNERITLSLPAASNPAYLWTTATCLEDEELAESLAVSLASVDCADSTTGPVVAEGADFYAFLDELGDGTLLDADPSTAERACLPTGESVCLQLSWELAEDFQGTVDGSFTLTFRAQQCRHNEDPTNPFPAREPCSHGTHSSHAISWVGFCAEDGTTIDASALGFDVDGDVLHLRECPETVGCVLLKYSTELRVFDDPADGATYRTTAGGATYQQRGPRFPETEDDRSNPTPCPNTCGVVYEIVDGTAQLRSTKGCSS